MKQRRFDAHRYAEGNLASARIIAADPTRWGGPEGIAFKWAQAILRAEQRDDAAKSGDEKAA